MTQRDHAEHNEQACALLTKNGGFTDWVVTTAFYSALHFVEDLIFPLTVGTETYKNINDYKVLLSETRPKHNIRLDLVRGQLRDIANEYQWLYDACATARYVNYKVSQEVANQARRHLDKIKTRKK